MRDIVVSATAVGEAAAEAVGSLLGELAREAAGFMRRMEARSGQDPTLTIAFSIAVIALSAKMAKADGHVSRAETETFYRLFQVPDSECRNLERVFDLAKRSTHGFEAYADQIGSMLRDRPAVLEKILDCLYEIAQADAGPVQDTEIDYLRAVAKRFGFDDVAFNSLYARLSGDVEHDAYAILGLTPEVSDTELKATYRRLARETHPDILVGQGLPPELIAFADRQLARVNAAYANIKRERQFA